MARQPSRIALAAGLALVVLGAGNVAIGNSKMHDYRQRKRAAVAVGGEAAKAPAEGTAGILDPATDAQLLYEAAAIKYEYYRVVRRGGLVFLGAGASLVAGALVHERRRRTR